MIKRLLALVVVLGAIVPLTASADPVGNCLRGEHATFGRLVQPQGGTAQVTTGPTGTIVVPTNAPIGTPAIVLSTTGSIQVQMEYACLQTISLIVTKDGSGTVYSNAWEVDCVHDTKTVDVPIGLDGGNYTFQLEGTTCNGGPIVRDGQGGVVGDPPLI